MILPDWNLDGTRLAGFEFTEWLTVNGSANNFVDEYMKDADAAQRAAEANGWVEVVHVARDRPRRLGDATPLRALMVTPAGAAEVERVRKARSSNLARRNACRQGLLLWLADDGHDTESTEFFRQSDFRFYGTEFTEDEILAASSFLRMENLIAGAPAFDGSVSIPELTSLGHRCVDYYHGNVIAFLDPKQQPGGGVTYNQNIGTVHGQVGQGQNVTQTQNQGIDAESLSAIFRAMRDALSTVEDPDDRDDIEHGIQQLEAAIESGNSEVVAASAGRLQRLGARVGSTASNAAVATATGEGIKQLLRLLGLA